jgi:hypothetical protein
LSILDKFGELSSWCASNLRESIRRIMGRPCRLCRVIPHHGEVVEDAKWKVRIPVIGDRVVCLAVVRDRQQTRSQRLPGGRCRANGPNIPAVCFPSASSVLIPCGKMTPSALIIDMILLQNRQCVVPHRSQEVLEIQFAAPIVGVMESLTVKPGRTFQIAAADARSVEIEKKVAVE